MNLNPATRTVGYNTSSSDIVIDQPRIAVVSQAKLDGKRRPDDFVVTSCFVMMLCNLLCGILAYHFGVKADRAWQRGDEEATKHHAKKAKICVIVGIVTGVTTYALTLGLYFT